MTAREFLEWALPEEHQLIPALESLGRYVGKGSSYFVSFPDAVVLDQDGKPLEEYPDEPAGFQEYFDFLVFENRV